MLSPYLSELRIFSFEIVPTGWLPCDGRLLPINQNQALFALLGTAYGGDGVVNFAIPDLRGRAPIGEGFGMVRGGYGGEATHKLTVNEIPNHTHNAMASSNVPDTNTPLDHFWSSNNNFTPYGTTLKVQLSGAALAMTGNDIPHDNMAPYLVTNICIAIQGIFPGEPVENYDGSWCGEIRMFAGKTVPQQYHVCDGTIYGVGQNTALFAVLGDYYGGSPGNTFALPDLRAKAAIKDGQGNGQEVYYDLGEKGGVTEVTLTENEIPVHTHLPMAIAQGQFKEPTGLTWANPPDAIPPPFFALAQGTGALMNGRCIESNGSGGAHNNMMPYAVVAFYISLNGKYPDRQ